jgi:hypothetical protein
VRLIAAIATLALLSLGVAGCHTSPPNAPVVKTDRSIADMQAEYAKLRQQNLADCLYGTPAQVKANQALCQAERDKMAPLGNALMKAEVIAARKQTNP